MSCYFFLRSLRKLSPWSLFHTSHCWSTLSPFLKRQINDMVTFWIQEFQYCPVIVQYFSCGISCTQLLRSVKYTVTSIFSHYVSRCVAHVTYDYYLSMQLSILVELVRILYFFMVVLHIFHVTDIVHWNHASIGNPVSLNQSQQLFIIVQHNIVIIE